MTLRPETRGTVLEAIRPEPGETAPERDAPYGVDPSVVARRRRPSQLRAQWKGGDTLYERLGGAAGLHRLVDAFLDAIATLPEAADLRSTLLMRPNDLGPKFFEFLSGWLGGPDLYTLHHGAPKLRRRHFLVQIGPSRRDAWLLCFRRALEATTTDRRVIEVLWPQVESLAHYLCNHD